MVENPSRRVLMKLSDEVLGGGSAGPDPNVALDVARQIAVTMNNGVQIAIMAGGENLFRGAELSRRDLDRARAGYTGILGTMVDALALQDFLEQVRVRARVQSTITMAQIAEPCVPPHVARRLGKGRAMVFGIGAGMPYFLTDTVSVQRALEAHYQEPLVDKNGVDRVCIADPHRDTDATKLDKVSYEQALRDKLKVVDVAAFALRKDNGLAMRVFGMGTPGDVTKALLGEDIDIALCSKNGAS